MMTGSLSDRIEDVFENVVLRAAHRFRGNPAGLVEFLEQEAADWRAEGERPDGDIDASDIAEFLDDRAAELFGACVFGAS